ncbi:hypothetical protein RhiirA4_470766 [Rhizophagus irregularis]|uniref:Uncharacterized protein n=1 Tax=Rhizophagus irregularis TaxID=588596 RepID=A0A2I1H1W8_9GLOM|nr:hypothetical protein RhiirA4_470766 [Rhizophagus irregularis]
MKKSKSPSFSPIPMPVPATSAPALPITTTAAIALSLSSRKRKMDNIIKIALPLSHHSSLDILKVLDSKHLYVNSECAVPVHRETIPVIRIMGYSLLQNDNLLIKPHWSSKELQQKGLIVVHFWYDKEFKNVRMSARLSNTANTIEKISDHQILP